MKMSKFKKRALIVLSTIIGVIALFLIVVFIPIGGDTDKTTKNTDVDIVMENEDSETSGLSKKELEDKVKELEEENQELKDEVEKYKILAEQTTQAISVPVVSSSSSSDKDNKDKTSSDDKEYKDSSEYYDENYKDYTNDDDEDDKDNNSNSSSSGDNTTTPSKNNSSSDNSSDLSDTGL